MTKQSKCAYCGKEEKGGTDLITCDACKLVKYCNASCQKAHAHKHNQTCEHDDEALFKMPPQNKDCPICMIPFPPMPMGKKWSNCCGKVVCSGCTHVFADSSVERKDPVCPFCRAPDPENITVEEFIDRYRKRVEAGDANGIHNYAVDCYANGKYGFTQDYVKAFELYQQAADLGFVAAIYTIGFAYLNGKGVERDKKKAKNYWELAAMRGHAPARHMVGLCEVEEGNLDRALKHFMINAACGWSDSLLQIRRFVNCKHATKEDYAKALKSYQAHLDVIRSPDRE